jgi:hypothetical protein
MVRAENLSLHAMNEDPVPIMVHSESLLIPSLSLSPNPPTHPLAHSPTPGTTRRRPWPHAMNPLRAVELYSEGIASRLIICPPRNGRAPF